MGRRKLKFQLVFRRETKFDLRDLVSAAVVLETKSSRSKSKSPSISVGRRRTWLKNCLENCKSTCVFSSQVSAVSLFFASDCSPMTCKRGILHPHHLFSCSPSRSLGVAQVGVHTVYAAVK